MFKYILETGGNINWMAILALVTFFSVFIISLYMVLVKSRAESERMANMPLEDGTMEEAIDFGDH